MESAYILAMNSMEDYQPFPPGDGRPHEACGVVALYNVPQAARFLYAALFALQHRGQESAGMVIFDGWNNNARKGMGLVNEVFKGDFDEELPGSTGIGHVRYSTTGRSCEQNIQPLTAECRDGNWAIAHNGNLVNAAELREAYQRRGAIFQTSTDSEILLHQLADPRYLQLPNRLPALFTQLQGSFAFVLLNNGKVYAARDPWGIRPLSIGRLGDGYVLSSETCVFTQLGIDYLRDVEPGEFICIDHTGLHSTRFDESVGQAVGQCVFEHIYFARPDSVVFGKSVYNTRIAIGRQLFKESPANGDCVVPIPDSGVLAALGFSQASGIPLHYGFVRNHYAGRTFILPSAGARKTSADLKLSISPDVVKNKRVIVVDDSIIRGNTCRKRIQMLRHAGAKEIHLRIACPPTRHPCSLGIDFPSAEELIANGKTVEEIRRIVEADTLAYLSLAGLQCVMQEPMRFCMGCFTGKYPVDCHGATALKC